MDELTAWDIYFAGIASIRFHPKNELPTEHDQLLELDFAARMADDMLTIRKLKWAGDK